MKPMLPKQFAKLATDNDEASEFLFGTSVCDRIETLTKENKLASMLDKEKSSKKNITKEKRIRQTTSPLSSLTREPWRKKGKNKGDTRNPEPSSPNHQKKKH